MLNQSLTTLNLPPRLLSQVQQVVALNICSSVRKVLSDKVYLSDEEAVTPNQVILPCSRLYYSLQYSLIKPLSKYLVQSPYSGSLTTQGVASDNP